MITLPKPRDDFTIFDVICDYTLNKVTFTRKVVPINPQIGDKVRRFKVFLFEYLHLG